MSLSAKREALARIHGRYQRASPIVITTKATPAIARQIHLDCTYFGGSECFSPELFKFVTSDYADFLHFQTLVGA